MRGKYTRNVSKGKLFLICALRDGVYFVMMSRMGTHSKSKRFIESWMGKLALVLLAVAWIFSMSGVDRNAYSALPVTIVMGVVALLIVGAVCSGYKLVRMSWLGWISLVGIGGYFLTRCCMSYSIVESWREGALILGCMVFYLMGVYAAQLKSNRWLQWLILGAVLLNLLYSYLMNYTELSLIYTGRPEIGIAGANTRPSTLFVYSNVGGAFLMIGGCVLLNIAMWQKKWRVLHVVVGVSAIVQSFYHEANVVFLLVPILLLLSWFVQLIYRLYTAQKMGWMWVVSGVVVIVAVGWLIFEFVFGRELFANAMDINTNGRYNLWKQSIRVAFGAPLWGYGASSLQWEVLPIYPHGIYAPNYAHNEYIQAWVDYGLVGLMLMLGVLLLHVGMGFWALTSEHLSEQHRKLKLLAIVVIGAIAACAYTDFFWHFYAIAALSAFCCGVLASPWVRDAVRLPWQRRWEQSDRRSLVPLRAQGILGNGIIVLVCLGGLAYSSWLCEKLYRPWMLQWEFARLCEPGKDDAALKRHQMQEELVNIYPDTAIVDCFYTMPLSGISWQRQEAVLNKVLKANPKNLFMIIMLGDVLCRQGKHQEAEMLYRRYYTVSKLKGAMMGYRWVSYYAYNLFCWGDQKWKAGDSRSAYSIMDYALNIRAQNRIWFGEVRGYDYTSENSKQAVHPEAATFMKSCEKKVAMFEMLGVQKDDSWMKPLEEGGAEALYQQSGNKPRRSPRKSKKR